MEIEPGLIVVNLEQCIPEALTASQCSEIIELPSPVNSLSEISQSFSTLQQHQLEQQLPLQYAQLHVGFEDNSSSNLSPLFQNPSLHFSSTSEPYPDQFLEDASSNLCFSDTPPLPPRLSCPSPSTPKEKKRRIPPDPNDIPKFSINQFEYYKEIEELLASEKYPDNATENYKTQLRKRAQNYVLIDNILYHNPKKPKKVIMKKDNQIKLLEAAHISDCDGVHLGIKKMYSLLHERFFWRCLYEDVASYANSCPKCRDDVDVAQRLRPRHTKQPKPDDDELVDLQLSSVTKLISSPTQTASVIWKEVEIQIHGPFNSTSCRNEFIVTITDPESCFVHASPFPRAGYSTKLTEFIVKTFYTFGFPKPYLVGEKDLFDIVSGEYDWRLKQQFGKRGMTRREKSECPWVSQILEILVRRRPAKWDRELDRFMYQFRTGVMRKFNLPYKCTPFYAMFQRGSNLDEKENMCGQPRVARISRNTFQCHTCDEVFTSKVSFGIHTKRHMMEVPKEESILNVLEGIATNKNLKPNKGRNFKHTVEVAMNELKNYLEKTKDDRRKRGKYQKFPVEIHEHMILYALKHGSQKAALYFSQLLGTNVSGSTIRNLVKAQEDFQPGLKEEIARYAMENGIDKASKYYSELLKKDVPVPVVRRFKRVYGRKFIKLNQKLKEEEKAKKANSEKIANLTLKEKYRIGSYSCEHSLNQTIKYFLKTMDLKLQDTDVEIFQKAYIDKKAKESIEKLEKEKLEKVQALEAVSYQNVPVAENAPICFSAPDSVVTMGPEYYESSMSYESSSFPTESTPEPQNMVISERFLLVSQDDPNYEITIQDQRVDSESAKECPTGNWSRFEQGFHINNQLYQVEISGKQICSKKNIELLDDSDDLLQQSEELLKQNEEFLQTNDELLPHDEELLETSDDLLQNNDELLDSNDMVHDEELLHHNNVILRDSEELLQPNEELLDSSSHLVQHREVVLSQGKLLQPNEELLDSSSHLVQHREVALPQGKLLQNEMVHQSNIFLQKNEGLLQESESLLNSNKKLSHKNDILQPADEVLTNREILSYVSPNSPSSASPKSSALPEIRKNQTPTPPPPPPPPPTIRSKKKKRKESKKKRGSYASYSPELRAEIGRYAAEHSSLKASDHFSKILGHDFPESTARGLKERYLAKVRHCDVSSLGYSPRGRPLRLGKYDELVQDCLKELVKSGEKASSFLAITTARQIVTKFEPGLLKENGGTVVLNDTWAKSFLKRVGIRNNS